jgi:hypothetical protein
LLLFATFPVIFQLQKESKDARDQANKRPAAEARGKKATMATETKMKALHYDGPYKVSVKEIDLPKIEHPDDVIIKVTTACICGSDLQ